MDRQVFGECKNLRTVVFAPGSVLTSIGSEFVGYGGAFESVTFPESLRTIGINAFAGMTTVKTLRMHRDLWNQINPTLGGTPVVSFYSDPIYYTWKENILNPGNGVVLNDGVFSGYYNGSLTINQSGLLSRALIDTYIAQGTSSLDLVVTLGSGVTELDTGIFSGLAGLTEVKFDNPDVITVIKDRSFQGCSGLKSFLFPSNVTTVGDEVFQGCTLLEEIVFPEGLTSLGTATFEDCISLLKVIFPQSLLTISGTSTLAGATAVRTLRMHRDLWLQINSTLSATPIVTFYSDTKTYTWIQGYLNLAKNVYDVNSPGLVKGVDDGSMTIIGSGELTQTQVSAAIDNYNSSGLTVVLTSVVVTGDFTSVGESGFQFTDLTSIVFSADSRVTTFGAYTFYHCNSLDNLVLPPNLTEISISMCYMNVFKTLLIPESVTHIAGQAFDLCRQLEHVLIPSKVTVIGDHIFVNCEKLSSVEFPPPYQLPRTKYVQRYK
jgi:hypothetical protein